MERQYQYKAAPGKEDSLWMPRWQASTSSAWKFYCYYTIVTCLEIAEWMLV